MRISLCFFLCLLCQATFGQEKITDFESVTSQSNANIRYCGTINNKIIYISALSLDETHLWVTDGTPEGTRLLKTFNQPNYFNGFHVQNGWLYFVF